MPKSDEELYARGTKRIHLDDYYEVSKAICKIIIKENKHVATRFFLHDASRNKFLLTNNHVISQQTLDSNMTIIIEIYDKRAFILKLNRSTWYHRFLEEPLDVTVIPINGLTDLYNCIQIFRNWFKLSKRF